MSKHTPGPWLRDGRFVYALNEHGINAMSLSLPPGIGHYDDKETQEANARLIAAAPELLEALQHLLEFADQTGRGCSSQEEAARAAIAKATGGEDDS